MDANSMPGPERIFTIQELRLYDGEDRPMYVACDGIVYDVSESRRWRGGLHEGLHFPAQDLTSELPDAPHQREVFQRSIIRRVGRLAQEYPRGHHAD